MYSRWFLAIAVTLCCSCTVKEERSGCPCYLTLDLNYVDEGVLRKGGNGELGAAITTQAGDYLPMGVVTFDHLDKDWEYPVPRENVWVCVWSEPEGVVGANVSIPVGEECPQVWLSLGVVDCAAEEKRDTVILHKKWCAINVTLSSAGSEMSRSVEVSSSSCGYDSRGFPKTGEFLCKPVVSGNKCSFRVPQQCANDLAIKIVSSSGTQVTSMRTFQIGEYLEGSGYDWQADDLADVDVSIDYVTSSLQLSFSGTRHTYRFELKI